MESKNVIKKISSEALDKKLEKDTDFTLIDTLTSDHFNSVHIVKSKNACVFEVTFPDQVNNLIRDKNKTIILYGFSEKTMDAVTAAEKLLRAGYQDIYVLDGGLTQWHKNGYALEGDDPDIISRRESHWILADCNFLANVSSEPLGTLKIESHFDFDRTRWEAIYGSARYFEKLGMHLVFDLISIQLRILAKAKN